MRRFLSGAKPYFIILQYAADVLSFWLAHLVAYWFAFPQQGPQLLFFHTRFFLIALLILIVSFSREGLYRNKRVLFDDSECMKILRSTMTTYLIIIVSMILLAVLNPMFYLVETLTFILAVPLISVERFILSKVIYWFRTQGYDQKRVIIYGEGIGDLKAKVEENGSLGYRIIAVTNSPDDLRRHLEEAEVVFLKADHVDDEMLNLILNHQEITWKVISNILNLVIDPVDFDEFKDYPIITVHNRSDQKKYRFLKRAIDIIISGLLLLLLLPLFALVALMIKVTSRGPIFFRQERLGKDLRPFVLYKFRTMYDGAESKKRHLHKQNEVTGLFKMKDDPRITPLGRLLRRSCLDELPQLFNILIGDMSLVGPRPHLDKELKHFSGWRTLRFSVKPGLTGMWQVNGRHELNFDKAVLYDIYYVKHQSLILDVSILLKTIPAILLNRGRF
ncbi:MAG: exopolysaccharide biosynthesis polyprenyl glycosylphosphotransferase [Nanoarchaeota archaeon]